MLSSGTRRGAVADGASSGRWGGLFGASLPLTRLGSAVKVPGVSVIAEHNPLGLCGLGLCSPRRSTLLRKPFQRGTRYQHSASDSDRLESTLTDEFVQGGETDRDNSRCILASQQHLFHGVGLLWLTIANRTYPQLKGGKWTRRGTGMLQDERTGGPTRGRSSPRWRGGLTLLGPWPSDGNTVVTEAVGPDSGGSPRAGWQ